MKHQSKDKFPSKQLDFQDFSSFISKNIMIQEFVELEDGNKSWFWLLEIASYVTTCMQTLWDNSNLFSKTMEEEHMEMTNI